MTILIITLIFGIVVMGITAWNMGLTFSGGMRSTVPEKIRAIMKFLLLLESIAFTVLFIVVLSKTAML